MKIRTGFVSNSSSSSYIITHTGKNNWYYDDSDLYLLSLQEKVLINEIPADRKNETFYLTKYISDCDDVPDDTVCYADGGHGGPYDEENYVEVRPRFWLRKEHVTSTNIKYEPNVIESIDFMLDYLFENKLIQNATKAEIKEQLINKLIQ